MTAAALDLNRRFGRAGYAVVYLLLGVPVAVLAIPVIVALLLGAALSVAGIGLPLLVGAAAAGRALVQADRRAANRWLDAHIPPLAGRVRLPGSPFRQSLELLADRGLWRTAGYLVLRPALVVVLLVVGLAPVFALAVAIEVALGGVAGVGGIDYVGPWALGPVLGVAGILLALPAAVLVIATLDALFGVLSSTTRALLAPRALPGGPVREMLAESLGDGSLSLLYWLPDRERFVDEAGVPGELPEPGSGRAWTAVERDGQRVAAIIHDAALDTSAELVEAAAAASSLAIDNERLRADLQARVEELRGSRLRIIEAGDSARRRIERDLHDGAQQQLVTLALELRMLKARLEPEAKPLVDSLSDRLSTALAELRELARGIHPAILTERGLAPAIGALAERSPLEIACAVDVEERLPPAVEAAAYFLVAEALTNVTRYAEASSARVDLRRDGDHLMVLIADDGIGGVDPEAGGGLRGLQDRVSAVGGTLEIDSPAGGGTRLHARLPAP